MTGNIMTGSPMAGNLGRATAEGKVQDVIMQISGGCGELSSALTEMESHMDRLFGPVAQSAEKGIAERPSGGQLYALAQEADKFLQLVSRAQEILKRMRGI